MNADIERFMRSRLNAQSRADQVVKLPNELGKQVEIIRAHDLDIVFFGSLLSNIVLLILLRWKMVFNRY